MPIAPIVGRRVVASIALLVSLTSCQLVTRFQDCQTDDDCQFPKLCNPIHHFCQNDVAEVCGMGMDLDQDGLTDTQQNFGICEVQNWHPGMGCRDGQLRCMNGALVCQQRTTTATEDCTNGIDDDCDGIVDNGATCQVNYTAVTSAAPMQIGSNDPNFGEGDDAPQHAICLAGFSMDKYEVSTRAYLNYLNVQQANGQVTTATPTMMNPTLAPQQFVLVQGQPFVRLPVVPGPDDRLAIRYSASRGWIPVHPDVMDLPMVNVTWFGADGYCRWAAKHLPSEAEWWGAARSATGTRTYPWGEDPPTCDRANVGVGGDAAPLGATSGNACVGLPVSVTAMPNSANQEGVLDLYGNVNQWMFDFLNDTVDHSRNNYYENTPDGGWCNAYPMGPLGPRTGAPIAKPDDAGLYCLNCRFTHGRNFETTDLRPTIRHWLDPDNGDDVTGFRCSAGGAVR